MKLKTKTVFLNALFLLLFTLTSIAQERPRPRDIGVNVGIFPSGKYNAITDVKGVRVGHSTIISGDDVRTGVTAIIPGPGNLFSHPVPAAIHVGNGDGKLLGVLVQTNFGGILTLNGAPVGRELGNHSYKKDIEAIPLDAVLEILRRFGQDVKHD